MIHAYLVRDRPACVSYVPSGTSGTSTLDRSRRRVLQRDPANNRVEPKAMMMRRIATELEAAPRPPTTAWARRSGAFIPQGAHWKAPS